MITKQQALGFIYELSQLHVVHLDVPNGYMYIDKEEYEYRAWADEHTFEALITEVIKDNMGNALLMDISKIPVDIGMLEVGQLYRVELDDWYDGDHTVHILRYTGKEGDFYTFETREGYTFKYENKDFFQLWKIQEGAHDKKS